MICGRVDDVDFNELVSLLKVYKKARCDKECKEHQWRVNNDANYKCCDDCDLADYEQGFCAIDELLEDIDKFRRANNAIQNRR